MGRGGKKGGREEGGTWRCINVSKLGTGCELKSDRHLRITVFLDNNDKYITVNKHKNRSLKLLIPLSSV